MLAVGARRADHREALHAATRPLRLPRPPALGRAGRAAPSSCAASPQAEAMIGAPRAGVLAEEEPVAAAARRRSARRATSPAGHVLAEGDLTWLRPGDGLPRAGRRGSADRAPIARGPRVRRPDRARGPELAPSSGAADVVAAIHPELGGDRGWSGRCGSSDARWPRSSAGRGASRRACGPRACRGNAAPVLVGDDAHRGRRGRPTFSALRGFVWR